MLSTIITYFTRNQAWRCSRLDRIQSIGRGAERLIAYCQWIGHAIVACVFGNGVEVSVRVDGVVAIAAD